MKVKVTTIKEIFGGRTFYEAPEEQISPSLRFRRGKGFKLEVPNCMSSVYYGGTCRCDSHPPYEEEIIPLREGLELIKSWGYLIAPTSPDDDRVRKLRRKVEDRLRKGTTLEVIAAAEFLGVPVDL